MSNILLSHWKQKLIALVLATTAWLVSNGRDYTSVPNKKVMVKFQPPKDGAIVMVDGRPFTNEISYEVELYGPRKKIEDLGDEDLVGTYPDLQEVSVNDIEEGQLRTVPIKLDNIQISLEGGKVLDSDIQIRRKDTENKAIELKLDKLKRKMVTVEPTLMYTTEDGQSKRLTDFPTQEGCYDNYEITNCKANPSVVWIRGPASVLTKVNKVQTMPARIAELTKSFDQTVKVTPYIEDEQYGRVNIESNDQVTIDVTVEELHKTRVLHDIPVRLLMPPSFWPIIEIQAINDKPVDAKNPTVDLEISGPGTRVSDILPEDHVIAFLDVTDDANPGDYYKPLTISLPGDVRLSGKTPVVKYSIKLTNTPE